MELDPEVPERPRPPRQYPAAYKLRILEEYEQLDKADKGALLRREGLYTSLISEWRKQRDKGALAALEQRRGRPPGRPARPPARPTGARQRAAARPAGAGPQGDRGPGELSALLGELATGGATNDSEPSS
jgi:transposase-like protein